MSSGDQLTVDIHDGAAGLVVIINDLTTGKSGSMTASVANGFAQVNFEPGCGDLQPDAVRVPADVLDLERAHARAVGGAQLQRRLLRRDRPLRVLLGRSPRRAATASPTTRSALDDDDTGCFNAAFSLLVPIGGCIASDADFDGTSYQPVGPARIRTAVRTPSTTRPRSRSRARSSTGRRTTAASRSRPTCRGSRRRTRAASATASRATNCVNPPPGSNFYPIYTTGSSTQNPSANGHCVWQFGGPYIKGTTNTFGGNSAAEFGPLLFSFYPNPNPAIRLRTNNFRNVLSSNPCPA